VSSSRGSVAKVQFDDGVRSPERALPSSMHQPFPAVTPGRASGQGVGRVNLEEQSYKELATAPGVGRHEPPGAAAAASVPGASEAAVERAVSAGRAAAPQAVTTAPAARKRGKRAAETPAGAPPEPAAAALAVKRRRREGAAAPAAPVPQEPAPGPDSIGEQAGAAGAAKVQAGRAAQRGSTSSRERGARAPLGLPARAAGARAKRAGGAGGGEAAPDAAAGGEPAGAPAGARERARAKRGGRGGGVAGGAAEQAAAAAGQIDEREAEEEVGERVLEVGAGEEGAEEEEEDEEDDEGAPQLDAFDAATRVAVDAFAAAATPAALLRPGAELAALARGAAKARPHGAVLEKALPTCRCHICSRCRPGRWAGVGPAQPGPQAAALLPAARWAAAPGARVKRPGGRRAGEVAARTDQPACCEQPLMRREGGR